MDSPILNNPMDVICRTCLKTHRKFINIFSHSENEKSITEMLMECATIKVEANDGLPQNICSACLKKLNSACSFKEMVINCDHKLHNFHGDSPRTTEEVKISPEAIKLLPAQNELEVSKEIEANDLECNNLNSAVNEKHESVSDANLIENPSEKRIDDTKEIKKKNLRSVVLNHLKKSSKDNNLQDRSNNTSDCENEKPDLAPSPLSDKDVDFGDDNIEELQEEPAQTTLSKSHRKKRKSGLSKKEQDQKTLLCKYCNKLFSFRYYYDIHIHQHTGNTPYKCDECDKRFVKRSMLNKHKQIHSDTKPYQCSVCGKRFKYLSNVHNHMVIHSEQKPYKCDVCNKGFKVPGGLKIHIRRHTGERPYICEICGKSFISQGDLVLHIGTHNTTKNFTCPKCGKPFANKMSLKVHLKRHSNYKPYACDRCNKSFSTNAILQHHILIHTGEKPYACNVCGKAFRQSACIPRHMRIHTGETPYPCEQCPSKFKYKHHLLNHMKTHT